MADIRINALATTATTPASDDYLALDGTAQGTRKILATNIANNVTDVILGTSGPSVKSTLSARAPRQGLVFDGTAATPSTIANIPAFGQGTAGSSAGDFTLSAWINTSDTGTDTIFGANNTGSGKPQLRLNNLTIELLQSSTSLVGASTSAVPSGKTALVTYTRSGTSGTFYINGISAGTITDGTNWSSAIATIGVSYGTAERFNGSILTPLIYNRALSASEVVALYEAGAPSGADYNSAGTERATTNWVNAGTAFTSFSSSGATAFTVTAGASQGRAESRATFAMSVGQRVRLTGSVASLSGTADCYLVTSGGTLGSAVTSSAVSANGTFTIEVTATVTDSAMRIALGSAGAWAGTFTSLSLKNIGLLLAPDAAQAGGGLVWYDTSGNSANITLPASGVSWNVPSSAKVATGWAFGGDVGIGTTSPTAIGSSRVTQINSTTGNTSFLLFSTNSTLNGSLYANASETSLGSISSIPLLFKTADVEKARITSSGNFLLGMAIDGGQKLQVSGTGYLSDSLRVGTSFTPTAWGVKAIEVNDAGGGLFAAYYGGSPKGYMLGLSNGLRFNGHSSASRIDIMDAGSIIVATSNTTALTLDSSQNATFAGSATATKYVFSSGVGIPSASTGQLGWHVSDGTQLIGAAGSTFNVSILDSAGGVKIGVDTTNITMNAPVKLNNAYVSGAPTATGYVTIKDSTGTTYKVLVGT